MLHWLPKVSNSDTCEFAIKSSQPTGMHFEKCHLIKKAGNHQDSGKKDRELGGGGGFTLRSAFYQAYSNTLLPDQTILTQIVQQ